MDHKERRTPRPQPEAHSTFLLGLIVFIAMLYLAIGFLLGAVLV